MQQDLDSLMRVIAAIISYYHHFFAFCGQESMKFFISLDILKFSNSQTNKQMHCKWIFNLMQWGQKFILQQHACQPSNKEFPLFYLKWNVLLGNTPRKNWGIHIAAFLSRQPLVKGERLVRYEVNAVMLNSAHQRMSNTPNIMSKGLVWYKLRTIKQALSATSLSTGALFGGPCCASLRKGQ